jgi:hypothetical protein
MKREQLQARCDPDTVDDVKAYQEAKGITKSEAVRRLIREGLEAKADEADDEAELRRAGSAPPLLLILIIALLSLTLNAIALIGGAI